MKKSEGIRAEKSVGGLFRRLHSEGKEREDPQRKNMFQKRIGGLVFKDSVALCR